ncbi:helix-turn-helix domain-containing protein [Streptomyces sp. MST-110588]|uniref:helix-turn-helix domain-containing protein n=1 Tax=Streptomyces sp. MST-110588 TaxID=2833628 RepID=UPI001F5CD5E5|nr:helix-turn-helix domain-containing protein [Streptomyces sp. MST-110588]UNO41590.1 helix-turn-helix domain-containing protein [Streptomyces sp. MST-110588]
MPETPTHFESLREQAVTLRREGLSRRQIRDRLHVHNNDILNRLLEGEPPPDWTRRPNAKDDLRAKARELRAQGMTYNEIVERLGVSKSSVSLWVRDLPKPAPRPEHLERMREARWAPYRKERDELRERTKKEAQGEVGELTDRDLFIAGVALYWAEGGKDKPYARRELVRFINSDPDVISLFLKWLELMGVTRERMHFNVSIHESADVAAAEKYWSELVGVDASLFNKTVLKRHRPTTNRKNTGLTYRGCLAIYVTQSADLYRRIEGWWCGIVLGARSTA